MQRILFITELEDGKMVYDAYLDSEVLVKCPVMCTLADNPCASEFEHHLGSCANRFCRKCNVSILNNTFDKKQSVSNLKKQFARLADQIKIRCLLGYSVVYFLS